MTPMTPQRYEQVRSIFVEVCDLKPLERSAVLDEKCADDPNLREEIESLLKAELSDELLRESRLNLGRGFYEDLADPAEIALPQSIGRYHLTRRIGQGGMGTVYEAAQENPQRAVAVKVIRSGLLSPSLLRRFTHEAQVLARLQHPGIAQIYEAGMAPLSGGGGEQPYFAMELVRGEPLIEFAKDHALSIRARLELLARIADAVHHAHTKGVIHRDLKPVNILVVDAPSEGDIGQPKILDFGVARSVNAESQSITLNTDIGQLVGTLPYMSPEQASGDSAEADTRSDVYALGVIGFELLTGYLPYVVDRAKPFDAVQLIRQQEATKLGVHNRALRGDVETIIARSLEKEKERRYQSAADFAADIRRYLNDEPIMARAPSAAYQFRKFAKRNRVLVSATLAIASALTVGLVASLQSRARALKAEAAATAQAQRATSEARKSAEILNFTISMLSSIDPAFAQGADTTLMRRILENAEARLDDVEMDEPTVIASLHEILGKSYQNIGEWAAAEAHLFAARELYAGANGEAHEDTLRSHSNLASLFLMQGRGAEGESLLLSIANQQSALLGTGHPDTLVTLNRLAVADSRAGRFDRAEKALLQLIPTQAEVFGEHHHETLSAKSNLAAVYQEWGKYDLALQHFNELIELQRLHLGSRNPGTLRTISNLALLCLWTDRLEHAEVLINELNEIAPHILGVEHPSTLDAMNLKAAFLTTQQQFHDAEKLHLQTLEIKRRVLGVDHRSTLATIGNLGILYLNTGQLPDAERLMRQLLEAQTRTQGPLHPDTLMTMSNLAVVLARAGRQGEVIDLRRQVLEARRTINGIESAETLNSIGELAVALAQSGAVDESIPLFLEQLENCRRVLGAENPATIRAMGNLARSYVDLGRLADAEPIYVERLELLERLTGAESPQTLAAMDHLAKLYWECERLDRAELLLRQKVEILKRTESATSAQGVEALNNLAGLYIHSGRFDEAEKLLTELLNHLQSSPARDAEVLNLIVSGLVALYEAWEKPAKVAEYRALLSIRED